MIVVTPPGFSAYYSHFQCGRASLPRAANGWLQ